VGSVAVSSSGEALTIALTATASPALEDQEGNARYRTAEAGVSELVEEQAGAHSVHGSSVVRGSLLLPQTASLFEWLAPDGIEQPLHRILLRDPT